MLAIPVPFVVSMLLGLLAITLFIRLEEQAKVASLFLALCAVTTAMVGLRWTFDLKVFSIVQPILASIIPIAAWYTFLFSSSGKVSLTYKHFIAPSFVAFSALAQPWLILPLDEVITFIYIGYGVALLRCSYQDAVLINISLGHWEGVKKAERAAGWMLLFSAVIDSLISLDFAFNQGNLVEYILTGAHLILLPVLSIAVAVVGINTPVAERSKSNHANQDIEGGKSFTLPAMSEARAQEITSLLDARIRQDSLFLDPELTLAKLTRKLGIPAKQISIAVNQVHKHNISKLINQYRIEHAKRALAFSQESITQIFMNSGFQTKSNFNREFSRVTGMTPSEYRKKERTVS